LPEIVPLVLVTTNVTLFPPLTEIAVYRIAFAGRVAVVLTVTSLSSSKSFSHKSIVTFCVPEPCAVAVTKRFDAVTLLFPRKN
jgi:hypothetical protein